MISREQRKIRRQYLGSSDSAAVFGLSDWKTAGDVYVSKTCELEEISSEAIWLGNFLEPALLNWAAAELGVELDRDEMITRDDTILCANLDGRHKRTGVESKTRGIVWPAGVSDEWGDDGTDQVPADVWMQCQHQMFVADLDEVYVPALIGGKGKRMYHIDRDSDQYMGNLREGAAEWWEAHVVPRVPPPEAPDITTVNRIIRRGPSNVVDVAQEIIDEYLSTRRARLIAEKMSKAAEATLKMHIGEGDGAEAPNGVRVTMTQVHRKGYAVEPTSYWRLNPPKD